jgi:hypothetical protein
MRSDLHFYVEVANLFLNLLMAGQLFCVMYWSFKNFLKLHNLDRRDG